MGVIGSHKMFSQAANSGNAGPSLQAVTPSEALKTYYVKKFPGVSVTSLFSIDAFKKGRAKHNIHWYVRELVQNWVDANPRGHNLDGIQVTQEAIGKGKQRFTIQGDWALTDFTALADLDTGKRVGENNAGGIGFGLKESFRDMLEAGIIDPPSVIGEGWSVRYVIVRPEDVNPILQKDGIQGLQKPFMASEQRNLPAGKFQPSKCSYVIETDNPELIVALSNFKNYAPHSEQAALQNPDYHCVVNHEGKPEAFTIKWLEDLNQRGSLFIQGQPWSYLKNAAVENGFFCGAHGVSLELGVVKPFEHDPDRGPLSQHSFESALELLIENMSEDDLKKQLQSSFQLWANNPGKFESFKEPGAIVLLEKIVTRLYVYHSYELADLFSDKDFVAVNSSTNQTEIDDLIREGKTICPEFFTRLGVTLYQRDNRSEAKTAVPASFAAYQYRKLLQENGAVIASDIPQIKRDDHKGYFELMAASLKDDLIELKKNNHGEWELVFDKKVPHALLNMEYLGNVHSDKLKLPAQLVQKIRNLVHWGLVNKVFPESPNLEAQGMMATFGNDYNIGLETYSLTTRVNSICSDPAAIALTEPQRLCFKLNPEHEAVFKEVFKIQDGVTWHPSCLQEPVVVEVNDQAISDTGASEVQAESDEAISHAGANEVEAEPHVLFSDTDPDETELETSQTTLKQTEDEPVINSTAITIEPFELQRFPWFTLVGGVVVSAAFLVFVFNLDNIIKFNASSQKPSGNQKVAMQPVEVKPIIGDDEIKQPVIDDKTPEMPTIAELPKTETPKPESKIGTIEVEKAIDDLAKKLPKEAKEDPNQKEFEKWKSAQKYGKAKEGADYTKGRSVAEFVDEFNSNGIENEDVKSSARDQEINRLKAKLEDLQEGKKDHEIQDFAIVTEPEARQIEQIEILREFMHKCTGVKDDVDFFVFTGKGTKGVNLGRGKAYGLHKSLFDGHMVGALEVYAHELSHNFGAHQDSSFYNTMQALLAKTIDRMLQIAKKPEDKRTDEDKAILRLEEEWNARAGIPNRTSMYNLQLQKYLAVVGARK